MIFIWEYHYLSRRYQNTKKQTNSFTSRFCISTNIFKTFCEKNNMLCKHTKDHHYSDRIEWKEHAWDFDLLQKSECLLCIMVSFNFYNLWVKAQRGIGICPSSHGWLAMDSQAETTDWIQILLALKPWFFTVTSCFQTPRVMSVACIEFGAASLEQRLFIMNSIWLIQRSFSKTQLPKCSPRDWIH